MTPLVRFRAVGFAYGEVAALDGVDAEIPAGRVVVLTGGNGAGKSTMIALLAGLERPQRGRLDWRAGRAPRAALAVQRISAAAAPMTVGELVAMGRWPHLGPLRRPCAADREIVSESIDRLGLGPLRHRRLEELSGGQRQRALVARALAERAELVLLDEPIAGLDGVGAAVVAAALADEAARGATIVHASHDDAAIAASDHRIHLVAGRHADSPGPGAPPTLER